MVALPLIFSSVFVRFTVVQDMMNINDIKEKSFICNKLRPTARLACGAWAVCWPYAALHARHCWALVLFLVWLMDPIKFSISVCYNSSSSIFFTDKYTLALAEKLLYKIDDCNIKGNSLEILSIYVIEVPSDKDVNMLLVNLLFDARRGWPYILSRQLYIKSNENNVFIRYFP